MDPYCDLHQFIGSLFIASMNTIATCAIDFAVVAVVVTLVISLTSSAACFVVRRAVWSVTIVVSPIAGQSDDLQSSGGRNAQRVTSEFVHVVK